MRFKTETKMRIQALKYRDGLENHQIAKEMGISQNMIWQYVESLEKQIKKGEITVADIVSSCNALKIDGPKKVRLADELLPKAEEAADNLKDEIAKAGLTADELAKNANEIGEAFAKAGELTDGISNVCTIQKTEGEDWKGGDFIFLDEKTGKYTNVPPISQGGIINDSNEKACELKDDIITKYMTDSLLTRDDITNILDVCAELKNCGYTAEEIVLTLNELKYFSDEIDKVGKQLGMDQKELDTSKDSLADFCRTPRKNPSPEFTAEQLRKMLTEATYEKPTEDSGSNQKQAIGRAERSSKSDYVLTIMAHIYDELVAGKLALKYYLMEDGVHELQFVEVRKK